MGRAAGTSESVGEAQTGGEFEVEVCVIGLSTPVADGSEEGSRPITGGSKDGSRPIADGSEHGSRTIAGGSEVGSALASGSSEAMLLSCEAMHKHRFNITQIFW